jgi:hypothetical protein
MASAADATSIIESSLRFLYIKETFLEFIDPSIQTVVHFSELFNG